MVSQTNMEMLLHICNKYWHCFLTGGQVRAIERGQSFTWEYMYTGKKCLLLTITRCLSVKLHCIESPKVTTERLKKINVLFISLHKKFENIYHFIHVQYLCRILLIAYTDELFFKNWIMLPRHGILVSCIRYVNASDYWKLD